MTARVLVVEHQNEAGAGYLGERLAALGVELAEVGPDIGVPVPASLDGFDGLIVLGGSMGPTDDDEAPWLPATRRLLGDAVAQQLPTLGICLGAQLLVTAAGGRVSAMPNGPEIGLQAVRLLEAAAEDPLLGGADGVELPVVQWHWLAAEELPEGASLLASSPACMNQAYRVGECAWGLQFHPEALGNSATDWAALDDLTAHGFDPERVVREVREAEPRLRHTWRLLAERFAALVEGG